MAIPTGSTKGNVSTAATVHVMTLPASVQNDVTFLQFHAYSTATVSSIVGNNSGTWVLVDNTIQGITNHFVYRCVQGATPDTSVTVTFSATERSSWGALNVRSADTTTPVDVSVVNNGNTASPTWNSVTPTATNSLILLFGSGGLYQIAPPEGMQIEYNMENAQVTSCMCASTYHYAASATGNYVGYTRAKGPSGTYHSVMLTVAVKDDTNAQIKPHHDLATAAFTYLYLFGEGSGSLSDNVLYDPTDAANENISSLSNGSYTNSSASAHPQASDRVDALEYGVTSKGFTTGSASDYDKILLSGYGITQTFGSVDNYDLSGKIISVSMKCSTPRLHGSSDIGACFGLSDKTNARFWQMNSLDTVPAIFTGLFPNLIDVDDTNFEMDSVGIFNSASVGNVIVGYEPTASFNYQEVGPALIVETLAIQGGTSSYPASFATCYDIVKIGLVNTILSQGGLANNQFLVGHNTQCGGTEAVYWDSTNQSIEWPSAYDADAKKINFKIAAGKLTHTVKPASGSTVIYDSTTLNFGNYHNFVLNSSSVAISSDGLNVLNADVTLTAHNGALSGISFIGCKEISSNGVDLSGGNTIANCVDTTAITVTSLAEFQDLHNCTFTGNNRAITITGDQSGSWADPRLTVDNNTYDIEYTGATDFSIQSVTPLTVNNTGAGTLTIVTPVTTYTINSSEPSSLIQLFTTGTQTLLDSTTGSSLAYQYSGTVVVDFVVQKAGFLPQRFTGVTLTDSSVSIELQSDPVYDSGHGLTYTTDFSYNRSTKELTLSTRQEGRDFYSALVDAFITQTSLRNTAFDFQAVGPDSVFFLEDAEIIDSSSLDNWKGAGIRYLSSADVVTAEWSSVKSSGAIPGGGLGEYQQQDGAGTTDLRATGAVDQIIQIYGDASHGNFDYRSHLVIKYQINGYREVRADVLALAGVSALEPFEYSIAMEPVAISAATGDPAKTITITDHGASPVTWNSKSFSITVQYSGADTGEDILREINYNLSLDTTYQGKDPFNWPEMIIETGSAYETARGTTEGGTGLTLKGVRVVNGSGDPHPDFTRFQADDGTYYTVPVSANGAISSIVSGSRVRIYNETTATETYNDVPGTSYAVSYTDGTTYSDGDVIKIYITQTSGTTAKLPFTTTVVASSTGWNALADQQDDEVYNQYGLNGSSITKFSADYVNDEVDLVVSSDFNGNELYAWWAYNLTTSQGIADFFGGITAQDVANLLINNSIVNIYLDNTTTSNVKQNDNIRIYRADGAYPVKNPTTGGGGIDVVWRDRVYIAETGVSGLTAAESTQLAEISSVNTKIGTPVASVSADIAALNDFDPANDIVARVTLVDTTTANTDMRGTDGANTTAPDNAGIAAVKAKTDQLTFTKANELDANIQSVNDVTVNGTGTEGNEWGP